MAKQREFHMAVPLNHWETKGVIIWCAMSADHAALSGPYLERPNKNKNKLQEKSKSLR